MSIMKNEQDLKSLMAGELANSSQYFLRLLHASTVVEDIGKIPQCRELCQQHSPRIYSFIDTIMPSEWSQTRLPLFNLVQLGELIESSYLIFKSILKLNMRPDAILEQSRQLVNLIYDICFDLHLIVDAHTHLDVQLPRPNFVKNISETGDITRFSLSRNELLELMQSEIPRVLSMQLQKEKIYTQWLHNGHQAMFDKDFERAQECFERALNLQDSAEAMTLLAWSNSLLNQRSKAKEWCLRAIQKDVTYGAAYNDLGSYLIEDGSLDEALKWFELAKRAENYQNREYPYINCGRIYLQRQNYIKSLEEFSHALTLAPYNEELNELVTKVKKALHKSSFIGNMDEKSDFSEPLFE